MENDRCFFSLEYKPVQCNMAVTGIYTYCFSLNLAVIWVNIFFYIFKQDIEVNIDNLQFYHNYER